MPLDALVKRFFPGIVLALIALAAYFQGAGIVELAVSSAFGVDAEGLATLPPATGEAARSGATRTKKSAEPILSRNPFDSVTGPLNQEPLEVSDLSEPQKTIDLSSPLAAQECDEVVAHIVTESPDPLWSLAVLQGPGEEAGKLRRVGDDIGDRKVAYIGFNPEKRSPAVWLANPESLCQALLFSPESSDDAKAPKAKGDKKDDKRRASRARRKKGGAPKVPKEIADKIQQVSDTEFNVDRAVVDNILENQASLMRSARIVPEQKNGKVVGIRLFGVRSETLLGKLGLKNGDRLESINDFDMTSPEKALEVYARLRTADNLNVKINRRGKPMSIDFRIK